MIFSPFTGIAALLKMLTTTKTKSPSKTTATATTLKLHTQVYKQMQMKILMDRTIVLQKNL